mmetsp:Transcript_5776/g.35876  ORF Transcript_5776/g.35876 Transcript_5776/m.35876 type:complete len:295 (-) Transcript_5776:77-961(-)
MRVRVSRPGQQLFEGVLGSTAAFVVFILQHALDRHVHMLHLQVQLHFVGRLGNPLAHLALQLAKVRRRRTTPTFRHGVGNGRRPHHASPMQTTSSTWSEAQSTRDEGSSLSCTHVMNLHGRAMEARTTAMADGQASPSTVQQVVRNRHGTVLRVHGRAQPRGAAGEAGSSLVCALTWEQAKKDARKGRAITSTRHSCDNNCKPRWREARKTTRCFLLGNGLLSHCFSSTSLLHQIASSCVVHRNPYAIDVSNSGEVCVRYRPVCNGRCKVARGMLACSTVRCLQQTQTTLQSRK